MADSCDIREPASLTIAASAQHATRQYLGAKYGSISRQKKHAQNLGRSEKFPSCLASDDSAVSAWRALITSHRSHRNTIYF